MAYTYATFRAAIALHMVVDETDPDFLSVLPQIIEAAELRICRELEPVWCRRSWQGNFGQSSTPEANAILEPPQGLIIARDMWFFPAGISGTARQALDRRDDGFLKEFWPDRAATGTPRYFAVMGGDRLGLVPMTILIAPTPDQPYAVEIAGTFRPDPLSATTASTYLSTLCPDLLLYAALVFAAGFQRNYGAQSDDPQQAMSWERQYQTALAAARIEEARRKSGAWPDRGSPSAAPTSA